MVADTLDLENLIPPPWVYAKAFGRYSIFWRQGKGESYVKSWWIYFQNLNEEEKDRYMEFFTEPEDWKGFYSKQHPLLSEELQKEIDLFYADLHKL